MNIITLIATLVTLFAVGTAQAQVTVNINTGCVTRPTADDAGDQYPKGESLCVEWDKASTYTTVNYSVGGTDYRTDGSADYQGTSYESGYLGFILATIKSCPTYKYGKSFEILVGRIALGKTPTTSEHNQIQQVLGACRQSANKARK